MERDQKNIATADWFFNNLTMDMSDGLTPAFLSTPTERQIRSLEIEVESLKKQLEEEQKKCLAISQERMDLRRELEVIEQKKSGCARPALLMAGIFMFFLCTKFFTTHRLSPDIGLEGEKNTGKVVGFHYEASILWGLSKKRYDQIRFYKGYPEYWDGKNWRSIPSAAWESSVEGREDPNLGEYYK